MKVKILKEVHSEKQTITESADIGFLNSIGIAVGKELGSGMFGTVYSVATDLGQGTKEYALKHVEKGSPGYERERKSYTDIKSFVDTAKASDTKDVNLEDYLPVIYNIEEHDSGLYILMEKLLPLTGDERKKFLGAINALAMSWSHKGHSGDMLIDYIIDTGGKDLEFNQDKAAKIVKELSRGGELIALKKNPQRYVNFILHGNGNPQDAQELFWGASMIDKTTLEALETLWEHNPQFKKFFNNLATIIVEMYDDGTDGDIFNDKDLIGMILSGIYPVIFAQKYPLQYTDDKYADAFKTGYGKSSKIYDLDVEPNPIVKEQEINPAVKYKQPQQEPKKYPYDPVVAAIRELGAVFNIKAADLHNSNVMKRENGQLVFVDVGLFKTKTSKPAVSGVFQESKRKIKVKIT